MAVEMDAARAWRGRRRGLGFAKAATAVRPSGRRARRFRLAGAVDNERRCPGRRRRDRDGLWRPPATGGVQFGPCSPSSGSRGDEDAAGGGTGGESAIIDQGFGLELLAIVEDGCALISRSVRLVPAVSEARRRGHLQVQAASRARETAMAFEALCARGAEE